MPKEFSRAQRLSEQFKRELSWLISREISDPRIGMVTISEVRLNKDLSVATIFFTALNEQVEQDELTQILQKAGGFLRAQLCKSLRLRVIPNLRFVYDQLPESSSKMDALIQRARAKDDDTSS